MAVPIRRLRLAALVLALLAVSACDPEGGIGPIIILTNQWREEGKPNHVFQLNDDSDGTAVSDGTFTGTETLPDGTQFDLAGFWGGGKVEFTVERGAQDVTWRGTISADNADRIEFTGSGGRLVLVR